MNQALLQLEQQLDGAADSFETLRTVDRILAAPDSENHPALAAFYNRRIQKALREIREYVGDVPRLWKFYSSGIVVKAGGTVSAFDLNCGGEVENRRTRLRFTPETLTMLVEVIDISYHTHAHVDHIGVELVDRLLRKGKMVITCSDAIRKWLLTGAVNAEKHVAPGYHCYPGFQRAGAIELPNTAFVLELAPGATLLVKGDIFMGHDVEELCDRIDRDGLRIDYAAVSPFALTPPGIVAECQRRYDSFFIPVHEWEFGHRTPGRSGGATQTYAELMTVFTKGKARLLTWGESMTLPVRTA